MIVGDVSEVGLSGQKTSRASDGVFDAAFLPRRMRVAEEGLEVELVQDEVACELGDRLSALKVER